MLGFCKTLRCDYSAVPTDDCDTDWLAVKTYMDGNMHTIDGPFATQDEAEEVAIEQHRQDLIDNGQFGAGA